MNPNRKLMPLRRREVPLTTWSRRITRAYGRSFYFASRILPHHVRQDAYDLYTLCRLIDDLTDEGSDGRGSQASLHLVAFLFADDLLAQSLPPALEIAVAPIWMRLTAAARLVPTAVPFAPFAQHLRETVHRCGIKEKELRDLLQGQIDDEHFVQPQTWDDFYRYCYRVAGVVGHMMAHVFGARPDSRTLLAAEHLGIAMQITNILRDITEDHSLRGRIYLPRQLGEQLGIVVTCPQDILAHPHPGLQFVRHLAQRGVSYYASGLAGVEGIPSWRGRLCARLMAAIYGAILARIERNPEEALHVRIVTSTAAKVWITMKVLLGRQPLQAAGFREQA